MKNIKILGPGCVRCRDTEMNVNKALEELGIEANVAKITDYQQIVEYDIMSTPALVIDEVVKVSGRIPTVHEIKLFLS
ncbi:MAG: thioredoxin family protein [Cyclonatronaceae bacterium]